VPGRRFCLEVGVGAGAKLLMALALAVFEKVERPGDGSKLVDADSETARGAGGGANEDILELIGLVGMPGFHLGDPSD
jgi:hypothetical protein